MSVSPVSSSTNNADLYKLLQQNKSTTQGGKTTTKTDSDGDHDGSKPGEIESSSNIDKLA